MTSGCQEVLQGYQQEIIVANVKHSRQESSFCDHVLTMSSSQEETMALSFVAPTSMEHKFLGCRGCTKLRADQKSPQNGRPKEVPQELSIGQRRAAEAIRLRASPCCIPDAVRVNPHGYEK